MKPYESRTVTLESSHSYLTVSIGSQQNLPPGSRPLKINGILRWQGIQYEISVQDGSGCGQLSSTDHVHLFDRLAGNGVDGMLAFQIYTTLMPIIEMQVQDIFARARKRKH
ncbi:MAG: hypothetical protein HY540_06810 [Deltaproteobacteria bacterium]|nr:hypothetical protein [Deltaproteobacteria bacterium]